MKKYKTKLKKLKRKPKVLFLSLTGLFSQGGSLEKNKKKNPLSSPKCDYM